MANRKNKRTYPYCPDYATPPGYVLQDHIEAKGFTPAEFAQHNSIAAELIENIIAGKAPIDADLAAIFGREFSLETDFWLDIEAIYRHRLKQLEEKAHADTAAN